MQRSIFHKREGESSDKIPKVRKAAVPGEDGGCFFTGMQSSWIAFVRDLVPYHQFAAVGTGVSLCLLLHPGLHAHFPHLPEVGDDIFVVADAVYDVDLAEVLQTLAGKFTAGIAVAYSVFFRAVPESVDAADTLALHLVRPAAVAFGRLVGAGAAEQAADAGGAFIGNTHCESSL